MKSRSRLGEARRNLGGGEGDLLSSKRGDEPIEEDEDDESDLARFLRGSAFIATAPKL